MPCTAGLASPPRALASRSAAHVHVPVAARRPPPCLLLQGMAAAACATSSSATPPSTRATLGGRCWTREASAHLPQLPQPPLPESLLLPPRHAACRALGCTCPCQGVGLPSPLRSPSSVARAPALQAGSSASTPPSPIPPARAPPPASDSPSPLTPVGAAGAVVCGHALPACSGDAISAPLPTCRMPRDRPLQHTTSHMIATPACGPPACLTWPVRPCPCSARPGGADSQVRPSGAPCAGHHHCATPGKPLRCLGEHGSLATVRLPFGRAASVSASSGLSGWHASSGSLCHLAWARACQEGLWGLLVPGIAHAPERAVRGCHFFARLPMARCRLMLRGSPQHLFPLQALRQMGLEGVLVLDIPPGTPADKAGMQVGASKRDSARGHTTDASPDPPPARRHYCQQSQAQPFSPPARCPPPPPHSTPQPRALCATATGGWSLAT